MTATNTATATRTATATPVVCSLSGLTMRLEYPNCVVEIQGNVGQTLPIELVLYDVTNGVSGFVLEVSATNPDIIDFVDVQHPQYLPPGFPGPIFEIINSGQAAIVRFQAADLNHQIDGEINKITIATISMDIEQAGTTNLTITAGRLDGDIPVGEDLLPSLSTVTSTLTVGP